MKTTPQHRNWISRVCLTAASAALALAAVLVSALITITTQPAQAQTFISLYSFCAVSGCPDGNKSGAGLVQGTDGNLYGTTGAGGAYDNAGGGGGTVFSLSVSLGPFVKTLPTSGQSGSRRHDSGNQSDRRDQRQL
jgi:hypothetical protein